jgi:uncharacterized cupin superfamily protein
MLEWPFHLQRYPRPPCIAVTGSGIAEANRLVSAPPTPPSLPAQFRELSLPLDHDPQVGWRPHPQFGGSTPIVDAMSCHVSVLCTGRQPHLPHAHLEEELLVVLEGEGELVMPSGPDDRAPRLEPLPPGSFVYYPAFALHTISNRAESPVTYLMFKWRGAPDETRNPLPTSVVRLPKAHDPPPADAFSADFLFEGSTAFLGKLHSHVTELPPGGGYAAHADEHDVAIVVLSGRVVTNNRSLGRHGIVYFPAGEPHDMWNPWAETARYLVFEFHRPASARLSESRSEVAACG